MSRGDGGPLLGRDAERQRLTSLLDGIERDGSTLVLRGEPGIGKSRLVAEAEALARERDIVVLRTTGVQSEARLAFSGLHQLLRPVRGRVVDLPQVLRDALDAAFGLADGAAPERFRIAMAALDLLSDLAGDAPVLIVVEDAHWLDPATSDVLAFVARRLESDPVVLLVALRDGYPSALGDAGLPELWIGPLDAGAAAELLDTSATQLTAGVRQRLLSEASGNPLALIELPVAAARPGLGAPLPALMPLTERLEHAFSARVSELPEASRLLLLVAALNDSERVGEVLDAGSIVAGARLDFGDLEPGAHAAIIDLDERRLRFRHPLMRSAVRQGASVPQRRRVHEALAEVLHEDPDRRVWHRAALVAERDEALAVELEDAARRARRRGAIDVALTALRRAAELSAATERARRLLAAAELAFELGKPDVVVPLLREAERLDPGPLERARATWIDEMIHLRILGDTERAAALIAAAEDAGEAGDRTLQVDLLFLLAQRIWWVDAGRDVRKRLFEAAGRLARTDADPDRILAMQITADPLANTPAVVARMRAAAEDRSLTAESARHLGPAAGAAGAFDTATTLLGVAAEGLRSEGRLGHLPRVLALHGCMAARLANWDVAIPAAEESRRLATELSEPLWGAVAETAISLIAGMRGDEVTAERAARQAEQFALPAGTNFLVGMAQFGRILAALGAGNHEHGYALADRFFDPTDPARHAVMACWHIGDLAEAALHIERVEQARERVAQVEAAAGDRPAVWIELSLRHAHAVLAGDDREADARFAEALAADLRLWPFPRARLLLAQGQWLRRRRRIAESRAPLRAARDIFDVLGCVAWGNQARAELRASGESSRRPDPAARDQLTAQELQIAHMAAEGLSNREIAQRLYLSHRTVGTHLYRAFPKLGITARSELAVALATGR